MNCPRCSRDLQPVKAAGVTVDLCQDGCGGIWFDLFELEKMDQPDESAGWLLDNVRIDPSLDIDLEKAINCPRCNGITLMHQKYREDSHLMVDKCRVCGGTWLDFGELFAIRSQNPTTSEQREKTIALLKGLQAPEAK